MRNNNNKVQKKYCLTSIVRVSSEARLGCKKYGLTLYFSSHGRMFSSAQLQRKSALDIDNHKKQTGKALPRTRRGLVSLRLTFCYSYLYVFTITSDICHICLNTNKGSKYFWSLFL